MYILSRTLISFQGSYGLQVARQQADERMLILMDNTSSIEHFDLICVDCELSGIIGVLDLGSYVGTSSADWMIEKSMAPGYLALEFLTMRWNEEHCGFI